MAIKKIKISNFKSFKDLEIELGRFNVLIGPNASGKSNFIQIFKFLRDITDDGLENAISMQGGIEYLRNINIGSAENFSLEVVSDIKYTTQTKKELLRMKTFEAIYKFFMRFRRRGTDFEIVEDKLTKKFEIFKLELKNNKIEKKEKIGSGEFIISNKGGKMEVDFSKLPKGVPIKKDDIIPLFLKKERLSHKNLLVENYPIFLLGENTIFFMGPIFSNISIYDFDSKLPKKATPITGKAELEEDGSNLAIVLKNILEDKEKKRKLSNLLKDFLPFVDDLDVEKFADKSLLFKLREIYAKKHYLPASLISDGTINIIALIIALYFDKKWLTIIEEPERNIHPYLISRVVEMMKDASKTKQIIVTTHNPEIVKYAGLENILLIARNKEGFSVISRPHEKEMVKRFLENELGIEELYVQNLLEI